MEPLILDHVCALTDGLSSGGEVLAQAQGWACALRLPLQVLNVADASASIPNGACRAATEFLLVGSRIPHDDTYGNLHAKASSSLTDQLFRPHGLSLFSSTLPSEMKNYLGRSALNVKENAVLVCSASSGTISRVLVLHALHEDENGFLHSTLSICRLFGVTPVILTLAGNELKARQGQRIAEEACLHHQIPALLDYVVGMDLRAAVLSIARWRRCSHVFMPRRHSIPWWRWPRRDILKLLLESDSSLSFLVLPESGIHTPEITLQSHNMRG